MWVRERKPKTAAEAGQLAEDYVQACQSGTTTAPRRGVKWRQEAVKPRRCHTCNTVGHLARDCLQGSKEVLEVVATEQLLDTMSEEV